MAKTFKITEEQYRAAMNEGIKVDVTPQPGETPSSAFKRTADEVQKSGMNMQKNGATLKMNPVKTNTMSTTMQTTESKVVKKDKINEGKLNELKKNSKVYSVDDFMKIISKND